MVRLSPFVPFGLVLTFQAWLWPFCPVFGLSVDTLYNLTFAKKMSFVFSHRESLQKLSYSMVWGEVPCQISYQESSVIHG